MTPREQIKMLREALQAVMLSDEPHVILKAMDVLAATAEPAEKE